MATRTNNRALILRHLHDAGALSRADLARNTGLSPAAVTGLVSDLTDAGLITTAELPHRQPRVGKPPTMLKLRPEARSVVAIDLSRPRVIVTETVDLAGGVVRTSSIDVGGEAVDAVIAAATGAIESSSAAVLGVGVGTPGVVSDDGTVIESSEFGWRDVPLGRILADACGVPVHVGNDADLSAIAEFSTVDSDVRNLAVVRIGSGVGLGLVLDDRPHRGDAFAAGEIGHLVVDPDGPRCACGHRGCLETFVAPSRIEQEIARGVAPAIVMRSASERFGAALAGIVAILDVRHIVVSTPIGLYDDAFCQMAAASLRRRCLEGVASTVVVRRSSLGDDIVVRGAAALVVAAQLGADA
ncbi:MAG: ROK family transcriptional regulator [Ilumatobacteraceae bacterium]